MDDRLLNLMGKLQHLENEILQKIQLKENEFFTRYIKKTIEEFRNGFDDLK
ncbi:MAG: hypothetical protein HOE64_12345 [Nitrospina sp.]|nr:hypothetical protein [Nitrospina sp.]